jgi:hypothetical protein
MACDGVLHRVDWLAVFLCIPAGTRPQETAWRAEQRVSKNSIDAQDRGKADGVAEWQSRWAEDRGKAVGL